MSTLLLFPHLGGPNVSRCSLICHDFLSLQEYTKAPPLSYFQVRFSNSVAHAISFSIGQCILQLHYLRPQLQSLYLRQSHMPRKLLECNKLYLDVLTIARWHVFQTKSNFLMISNTLTRNTLHSFKNLKDTFTLPFLIESCTSGRIYTLTKFKGCLTTSKS